MAEFRFKAAVLATPLKVVVLAALLTPTDANVLPGNDVMAYVPPPLLVTIRFSKPVTFAPVTAVVYVAAVPDRTSVSFPVPPLIGRVASAAMLTWSLPVPPV